jgi:hypothetical protein
MPLHGAISLAMMDVVRKDAPLRDPLGCSFANRVPSGRGLLDYFCVTFELVTDRRSNEISAVGVEPVLHH